MCTAFSIRHKDPARRFATRGPYPARAPLRRKRRSVQGARGSSIVFGILTQRLAISKGPSLTAQRDRAVSHGEGAWRFDVRQVRFAVLWISDADGMVFRNERLM